MSAGAPPGLVARTVRLAVAPWASPERTRRVTADLLDAGGDPGAEAVLAALEAQADDESRRLPTERDAAAAATRLRALDTCVHLVGHQGYPAALQAAWPELGAPVWLFVRAPGRRLPGGSAVAVVGTRRPTLDGLRTARDLGALLARAGVVVVSGMARGIDQAAHRGALDAGGITIGVLGTGLDIDYPAGSTALREAVAASGGLVTEQLPGVKPRPPAFLWRNRIVAGLAAATVVVEGRARSGALQTARLAAGQGREVFAVPGSLNAPTSRAPLDLIRDGARPLTQLDEVLEVVGGHPGHVAEAGEAQVADPVGQAILGLLGPVPASPADLAAASGTPIAQVLAAVAELAERGLARATPRGVIAAG